MPTPGAAERKGGDPPYYSNAVVSWAVVSCARARHFPLAFAEVSPTIRGSGEENVTEVCPRAYFILKA